MENGESGTRKSVTLRPYYSPFPIPQQMPDHIRSAWFKTLGQLAAVLAVAVLLGWLLGQVGLSLAIAAIGVVVWHYWQLRKVLLRLTARQRLAPAQGKGVWRELDRLLYRSQDEMRARKRRLLDMLRAYRAAADVLPDAVVVVYPSAPAAPVASNVTIGQQRMRFVPLVTVVAPGSRVRFTNLDRWDHHIRGTAAVNSVPGAPSGANFEMRLAGATADATGGEADVVVQAPGAVLLDVGVSRTPDGALAGDLHPDVWDKASWVSPNPGGVGPMTRAMLLSNVVDRAESLVASRR